MTFHKCSMLSGWGSGLRRARPPTARAYEPESGPAQGCVWVYAGRRRRIAARFSSSCAFDGVFA
jgi:hypothetical protein